MNTLKQINVGPKEETTMDKIKMHENDSIRNLTEVMVNSCGIDRAQANAAVNAVERTRHNQFGTIGKFKEATETENGRKELIDILHLGPKRLGYLMRALHFIDIKYNNTDNAKPIEEPIKKINPRYSGIGRVTLYFSKEVAGSGVHEVESCYLMWVGEGLANSQMILDGSEMTRPGLMIINDDDMLPGFIRITDEFGYSRLFKKELLESMDVEMFDIEKPDDLE